jgi:hypothetical protein
MGKIAIFVSHRIDQKSELVKNPLYHHIRCGAVFDKSNSKLRGDDTGDNISEKRNSFCELTVQYWAWKNYKADYYGLCHYRRYLSFSEEEYPLNDRGNVLEPELNRASKQKFLLLNKKKMKKIIMNHDVLVTRTFRADELKDPPPPHETVFDLWMAHTRLVEHSTVSLTIQLIQDRFPEYFEAAQEYLASRDFRGYNCYIMRRDLFFQMCEFQFHILFELEKHLDMTNYTEKMKRTPGFMGELLFGVFIHYLEMQNYKIKELELVLFLDTRPVERKVSMKIKERIKNIVKKIARVISPAYRIALKNEQLLQRLIKESDSKRNWVMTTHTADYNLIVACLANEIHETHKESFSEFRNYNTGRNVVIVATGPTMSYYQPISAVHIGVNKAFKNEKVNLDYYFTTDYESRNDWFEELKHYNFVKFFGQYPAGRYRDTFQVSEKLILENNARRFFQGAPRDEIHINIEYYPLMGFYSIAFQAIHFALYTNAKRIFLVGCDCTSDGYFDGSKQRLEEVVTEIAVPGWLRGYQKFKAFTERFYPETEIISVNPVGLKGLFYDVYTENYLAEHPEIDRTQCEILDVTQYEEASL